MALLAAAAELGPPRHRSCLDWAGGGYRISTNTPGLPPTLAGAAAGGCNGGMWAGWKQIAMLLTILQKMIKQ